MEIAIQGILTGLVLSIYVGATFFTIMETSMRRGALAAMILNTGVWVSDVSIIALAYIGAAGLLQGLTGNLWIRLMGGFIFLVFGLSYFFRKPKETIKPLSSNKRGVAVLFLKGFAINSLNPGVYVFWFGAMVMAATTLNLSAKKMLLYFGSTIMTVVIIDIIKVLSSTFLHRFINENVMSKLFRLTGVILAGFGLFLIIQAL